MSQTPCSDPLALGTDEEHRVALYLFGVSGSSSLPGDEFGLMEAQPLRALTVGSLTAIFCEVAQQEWSGSDSAARLQNLDWLAPRALRHQAILDRLQAQGALLPMRFGCLFSSETALSAWLLTHAEPIRTFLQLAQHHEEWSLKGWLDPARTESFLIARDPRFLALSAQPGARYLQEKRLRQDIGKSIRTFARSFEKELTAQLHQLGIRTASLRALSGEATGRHQEVVFHHGLLIPSARIADIQRMIDEAAASQKACGLSLELTGPWPLYSFIPALDASPSPEQNTPGSVL